MKISQKQIIWLLVVLSLGFTIILYVASPSFLNAIYYKFIDLRFKVRGEIKVSDKVVIAAVDEKSISELGHWPWSRKILGGIVQTLSNDGAKVIAFDMIHAEATKDDFYFEESVKKSKSVVLGYFFDNTGEVLVDRKGELPEEWLEKSKFYGVDYDGDINKMPQLLEGKKLLLNLPQFSKFSASEGFFNVIPDEDGVVRYIPLVMSHQNEFLPSLGLQALKVYYDRNLMLELNEGGVRATKIDNMQIPTDTYGRLFINYYGKPKTFRHYSMSDIFGKKFQKGEFKDKIVLIGATAVGIYDIRVTPFSNVFPGTEIHATAVENIINQDYIIKPKHLFFYDILSIILLAVIAGFIAVRASALYSFLAVLLLSSIFVAFNIYMFVSRKLLLTLTYPLISIILSYSSVALSKYITEEKEKRIIKGAFHQYVNPAILTEIMKDPKMLNLGGEKKELSVLFSDIRGFTTISENLRPEELVRLLNQYLTEMTDIVFKNNGYLDKYIGDAIMAVYGAPVYFGEHADRACLTAVEMISRLKYLREEWVKTGYPPLNIGVGINTGEMVAGNMGSLKRFDYTVMGDNVNLASRIEGVTKSYGVEIVITEFTANKLKNNFILRELDFIAVKGKKLPVRIFELRGEDYTSGFEKEFIANFQNGLKFYREKEWDRASEFFNKSLLLEASDYSAKMYIERLNYFKKNPPPSDWNGVFVMTTK